MTEIAGYILIAIAATEFAIYWSIRVAMKINLVDSPGGRKQHSRSIPLVGGLALFLSFAFTSSLLPMSLNDFRNFFTASGILIFIGLLDDFQELTPRTRLIMQVIAALIMAVWGGNYVTHLGHLLSSGPLILPHWLGVVFTLFAVTALINAYNMLDGLDGLLGGVAFVQLAACAILALWANLKAELFLLLILLASLAVFLRHNFPWRASDSAKIFMGDLGSMFMGFVLAWFTVWLPEQHVQISPVTSLWILALPIVDTVQVVLYRLTHKQSPLAADREHIHHLLLRKGYSSRYVSLLILTISVILSTVGLIGTVAHLSDVLLFVTFIGMTVIYCLYTQYLRDGTAKEEQQWQI